MQDSTDTKITYKAIRDRANRDAMERMPDLPKLPNQTDFSVVEDHDQHVIEAWESFISDLESIDAYEIASELSEWDWVIYYHRAMELCQAVPNDVLNDAESDWRELDYADNIEESFGLFELAGQLAAIIVTSEIVQAIEQVKEELTDLAQTAIDNQ